MTVCLDNARAIATEIFGEDKPMSTKQLKEVIVNMAKNAKRLMVQDATLTQEDALAKAAKQLIEQDTRDAALIRKRAYLNVIALANRRINLKALGKTPKALRGIIEGTSDFRFSVGNMQQTSFSLLFGGKDGFWTRLRGKPGEKDLVPIWKNKNNEEDIANSMLGNDDLVTSEDNRKVGKILKDGVETGRRMNNKWGADYRSLKSFIATTTHDPMKMLRLDSTLRGHLVKLARMRLAGASIEDIRTAAFERWKNFTLSRLNHDLTFVNTNGSVDEVNKFMRGAFDGLISKIHKKFREDEELTTPSFKRGASFARSTTSKHRLFIFKDEAAPWLEYNRAYGQGTLQRAILHLFERSAKNYGLLKFMGPDFSSNYDILRGEVARASQLPSTSFKLNRIDNIMKEIDGTTSSPVSYKFARIASNMRSWTAMARLGLVVPRSISDIATKTAALRFNDVGFLDAWSASLGDLKNIFGEEKDLREVHDLLGASAESMIGAVDRFRAQSGVGGGLTGAQQVYFKMIGLLKWDHIHREGGVTTISRRLAQSKNQSWDELGARLQNALSIYTVKPSEWEVLRKNPFTAKGRVNREYITPDSGSTMTKEEVAAILGKNVEDIKPHDIEKATDDLQDKMMMYFNDNANHIILRPTVGDRAAILMGSQPGTVQGEALRFMAQFKMYSLAFTRRVLARSMMGTHNGKAAIAALAELAVGTAILNHISLYTIAFLEGKTVPDTRNMTLPQKIRYYAKVWAPSMFLVNDWIEGNYNTYGQSFIKPVIGPVFSTANDISSLMSEIIQGKNVKKQLAEVTLQNTPYHNVYFADGAIKYLMLHAITNRIAPGAVEAARRRMTANGQHYIFNQ